MATELAGEIRDRVALNLDLCIDCRSCSAACFYGHGQRPALHFGTAGPATLPVVCRQCRDAWCVAACPNGAMRRSDAGVVYRSVVQCCGCGSCAVACPFGVVSLEMRHGEVAKCDLCHDILGNGTEPRCVASCPSGALRFMDESAAKDMGLVVLGSRTLGEHPIFRR